MSCSFFNNDLVDIPSFVNSMKRQYRKAGKEYFARYQVEQVFGPMRPLPDEGNLADLERDLYHNMYSNDHPGARMIMEKLRVLRPGCLRFSKGRARALIDLVDFALLLDII